MPLAPYPVPDDFTGATDDIKIAAAVAVCPVLAFDRAFTLNSLTSITPGMDGQQFVGAAAYSPVASITKTSPGSLFNLNGHFGITIAKLQMVATMGLAGYGAQIDNSNRCIIERCLIRGFGWGGVGGSAVLYARILDNEIAGPQVGTGTGIELDAADTSCRIRGNDISGYGTLVRTWCDGASISDNVLEGANQRFPIPAPNGQGIRVEQGSAYISGNWSDASSMSAGTIAQVAGSSVSGGGNRGVTKPNVIITNPATFALGYQP